jgi:hypothetical protein
MKKIARNIPFVFYDNAIREKSKKRGRNTYSELSSCPISIKTLINDFSNQKKTEVESSANGAAYA